MGRGDKESPFEKYDKDYITTARFSLSILLEGQRSPEYPARRLMQCLVDCSCAGAPWESIWEAGERLGL